MVRPESRSVSVGPVHLGGVLIPAAGKVREEPDTSVRAAQLRAKENTMSLSDEDITTTPTSATSGGGDADQGDTREEQVDPAGSDPAGKDPSGADSDGTDGDADGTDGGGDADGTDGAGS
jgi:hypothetical protein